MVDLRDERGHVLVPSGSTMRGVVSSVNKATRTDRKGALTVAFDRVTINGRAYPIRATVTQAIESEGIMGEKEKIGIGAGAAESSAPSWRRRARWQASSSAAVARSWRPKKTSSSPGSVLRVRLIALALGK